MKKYHCIDSEGNLRVMNSREFFLHKLLNKNAEIKKYVKFDSEWYLLHGYCTCEDLERQLKEKYGNKN